MPFLNIDNNWSNLAQYYNQEKLPPSGKIFLNRPSNPPKSLQFQPFDDGFIRGGITNAVLASAKDVIRIGKFITGTDININTSILSKLDWKFFPFLNNKNAKVSDVFKGTKFDVKGSLFLAKQFGLQQTNPRLEFKNQGTNPIPPLLGGATRQFTGLGMIESIGGNAFGLHFDRAGLLGKIRDDQKYGGDIDSPTSGVAYNNNFGEGKNKAITSKANNRLLRYAGKRAEEQTSNLVLLDRYSGGAKSIYGIGITSIHTYTNRTSIRKSDLTTNPQLNLKLNGFTNTPYSKITEEFTYTPLVQGRPNNLLTGRYNIDTFGGYTKEENDLIYKSFGGFNGGIESFNANETSLSIPTFDQTKPLSTIDNPDNLPSVTVNSTIRFKKPFSWKEPKLKRGEIITTDDLQNAQTANTDYSLEDNLSKSLRWWNKGISGKNIEARIGVSGPNRVDSINIIDVTDSKTFFAAAAGAKTPNVAIGDKSILGKYGRDIIKFRIEFLNNDNPVAGGDVNTDVLAFRAYLDDFNDGMNAKWNSYRYMGRGEDFYVYEGFTRDIGLSFTMFAHTQDEMKPLYKKLNYLMSTFAPDYSKSLKMRGNIAYLTVGDYLYRQPGVFTDIKLSGMLESHWEIAMDEPENGESINHYEIPKMIKVGLSFKPIHTFLPRKTNSINTINAPFITPDKLAYKNYTGGKNKYLD